MPPPPLSSAPPDPVEAIDHSRLFRHMPPAERAALASRIDFRRFRVGEVVVERQEDGDTGSLYLVAEGVLLAHQYARSGREVGFRRIVRGQYFGELSAIDRRPRSLNITALTPAVLGLMPRHVALQLIDENSGFRRAVIEDLAAGVRELSDRVFELSVLSIPCRLGMTLLRMGLEAAGSDNEARLAAIPTHAELAAVIGGQREAVTREFGRLESLSLIAREGRTLRLLDMDGLAKEVERAGGERPVIGG